MPGPLLALFGPTGVGKTAVALALAEILRGRGEDPVAISADALQVYEGLEVLTGAAAPAERARLEHRLVSFVPVSSTFSAGEFAALAHQEIDAALAAGRRPILVGGTGLYLRAALTDLDLRPPPPPGLRARLRAELAEQGPQALYARLAATAPWAAERIEVGDSSRIVRALELHELGELRPRDGPSQLWTSEMRVPTVLAGLTMERSELDRRIESRVDGMLGSGARREVERAAPVASATARKALGFEHLLAGDVDAMKRDTRRYARRQLTWMRKLSGVRLIDVTGRPPQDVAREILAGAA
ncbi:MAG TPA: tRNA (adenosine(37)-N6)-dimethylallyltransferase MiaA [Thermoleophilaceae bacterium]|nr:tRNA (adenosine(37)-N6)-dimethylallyltransferase MiaA [Thermoleophilaceae bacterium]